MANDKYVNQAEKENQFYDIRDARIPELEIEDETSLRKTELNATGLENSFERETINPDTEETTISIDKAIYQSNSIEYSNIEGNNEKIANLQYPKLNGSKTFAISVNGVDADEEGNVNITIPAPETKLYKHNLQIMTSYSDGTYTYNLLRLSFQSFDGTEITLNNIAEKLKYFYLINSIRFEQMSPPGKKTIPLVIIHIMSFDTTTSEIHFTGISNLNSTIAYNPLLTAPVSSIRSDTVTEI